MKTTTHFALLADGTENPGSFVTVVFTDYWNDERWRAIHRGAKTIHYFLLGHQGSMLNSKEGNLIFEWEQKLKRKYESGHRDQMR